MKERILTSAYQSADWVRHLYWRAFKPERFGVKVLVVHPTEPNLFALIRQSYGDTGRLTLPGGGYSPRRETPTEAARREVRQELGVDLAEELVILSELTSRLEGKIDRITVLGAMALNNQFRISAELAEATWADMDEVLGDNERDISRFVSQAISAYRQQQGSSENL